jgi:hypothetical protein
LRRSAQDEFRPDWASNRVRDVDEAVIDPEALGDELAEPANAESLGRVVPAGDEVNAVLARVRHHVLGRLAREERIVPGGDRLSEVASRRAGVDDGPMRLPQAVAVRSSRRSPAGSVVVGTDEDRPARAN